MTKHELYELAKQADDTFQSALEARYGSNAGNMRYRTSQLPADIQALGLAYQLAMQAHAEVTNG